MVVHQHRSSHGCRVAVNCPAHRSTMTPPQSRKVNWWLKICHASINWPCTVVMRAIFHEHPYRPMSPLNWHVSKIIRESLSFCFVFVRVTEFETNKKCFSLSISHTVRPLLVEITFNNQPLSAERNYDIECQSVGSRPPARITWWINGIEYKERSKTVSTNHRQKKNAFKNRRSQIGTLRVCFVRDLTN